MADENETPKGSSENPVTPPVTTDVNPAVDAPVTTPVTTETDKPLIDPATTVATPPVDTPDKTIPVTPATDTSDITQPEAKGGKSGKEGTGDDCSPSTVPAKTAWAFLIGMLTVTFILISVIIALYVNESHLANSANNLRLLLAAVCGALGAMVYILRSFTSYWGNGTLKSSWLPFYVVQPFVGSGLAVVFYFVADAWLNTGNNKGDYSSLNNLLGLSFLVGMFTDMAVQKLRDVIKAILATKDERSDKLSETTTGQFTVTGVSPGSVPVNVNTPVKISGKGFTDGLKIQTDAKVTTISKLTVSATDGTITFDCLTTAPAQSSIELKILDVVQVVKATVLLSVA